MRLFEDSEVQEKQIKLKQTLIRNKYEYFIIVHAGSRRSIQRARLIAGHACSGVSSLGGLRKEIGDFLMTEIYELSSGSTNKKLF